MPAITIKSIKDALTRKDAPLFKGELNLTLVGVRSSDTDANTFNDVLCVLFQLDSKWQLKTFPCTTDPGVYYRKHPLNVKGTAILKPGIHRSCWKIGAHQGRYKALVQRGLMTVFRDNNKDESLDETNEQSGYFGINLHCADRSGYTMKVDRWSAGCQVMASRADFDELMDLVNQSAAEYGPSFSYTLLEEKDL